MHTITKTLITTTAIIAALAPAAASADSLVVDAPGARDLTAGGGWLAWSAPDPGATGQWKLTLRAPDGTVSQPAVDAFSAPVKAGIGTNRIYGSGKQLVAVYSRAGDVYELDLAGGTEKRLSALSTSANESLAAVNLGQYVVVRKDGAKRGLWVYSRSGKGHRLTKTVPSQIAMAESRVASIEHGKVVIRRLSGKGRPMVAGKSLSSPSGLWLTRYRAGWSTYSASAGTTLYATKRFAGSGGPYTLQVVKDASWTSQSALYGIGANRSEPTFFLDDKGVNRFDPIPFHGA